MIYAQINDPELEKGLALLPEDGITRFSMLGGTIKGALLAGTRMAVQARANHELGILESLALSQGLIGTGLASATIKDGDQIGIRMDCTGPLRGFSCEASWDGKVRGYLFTDGIVLDRPPGSFDLKPYIGRGTLSVIRKSPDNEPYTGHIELVHGRIAEDITEYFLRSEQTRTALALSVHFDQKGRISGAGGLFFQALPGADDTDMEDTEVRMQEMVSLGNWFAQGKSREEFLAEWFAAFDVQILARTPVCFECSCSKERFLSYLKALGPKELRDMAEKGPLPLETRCHYCNTRYVFSRDELESLIGD
ncbi:Hsp33 family molecular chaperone HslO [Breznakiella homolactica]|uniref:Hsp33 family molecular chaperone HslO n=1 Tax=Breznakiella homolactica TaxID=2798577 RepID=A0A7T7XLR6_9SPIR|nr:Hsp33 family molecular chaperone HslO [Breznakiella homolactica]QQO08588.1 Hsp33 family molecular chaperone HslO [Breznakiella homolactica]